LDRAVVMSIFKAMRTSRTLVSCTFEDTNINGYYMRMVESRGQEEGSNEVGNWFIEFCKNREVLETVMFRTPLRVPHDCMYTDTALKLQKIQNGQDVVWDRDQGHPPSPLRQALDLEDPVEVQAALSGGASPGWEDYRLAVELDDWRSLAALLTHRPPTGAREARLLGSAAFGGRPKCAELLLFWGAGLEARDS